MENKTDEASAVRSQESLLQEALRGIAESLISDAEILPDADVGVQSGLEREPSPLRSSSPSRAPNRAERAPAFAETAVAAVQQVNCIALVLFRAAKDIALRMRHHIFCLFVCLSVHHLSIGYVKCYRKPEG